MKILLITSEEWNDYVYSNGVLTNWFTGFDGEFAQIYSSPGLPNNKICHKYFQITDAEMAKSLVTRRKSGNEIQISSSTIQSQETTTNAKRQGIYGIMKNISLRLRIPVVMLRDFIWLYGRYNKEALCKFVTDFNPDVVFCPRMASPKQMRLEGLVHTMTNAPFIAFTGDNEAPAVSKFKLSLSFLRKYYIHKMFAKHIGIYSHYMMHSADQAEEYKKEYGIETILIYKCGDFTESFNQKQVGNPIRLVYAGRLYCNRWKSLEQIGKALQIINKDSVKMVLDVYTQEQLTKEQNDALNEEKYIYVKGSVTPSELKKIYEEADIALHVESLDNKFREATRVSFSTKIIDLMESTCAILAICWEKHAGYQYLKENDAAFCISDYDDILLQLQIICNKPSLISEYAQKAYNCGAKNHSRSVIQSKLRKTFESAISSQK